MKVHVKEVGDAYEIYVEDNGIGFDEKYLDKIFLPFQRLQGKSSNYEGVRMGVAICRKIAERRLKPIRGQGRQARSMLHRRNVAGLTQIHRLIFKRLMVSGGLGRFLINSKASDARRRGATTGV